MAPSFLCECHINMSPRNLNLDAGQSACAALLMSQLFHADDGSHRDIYTGSKTISRSPIPPKKNSTVMEASARSGQLDFVGLSPAI